jgi:hypothetical protein
MSYTKHRSAVRVDPRRPTLVHLRSRAPGRRLWRVPSFPSTEAKIVAQDEYTSSFDSLVEDLAESTRVDAGDVATILKRLSFPQTLEDLTRFSGAEPRKLSPNDLRVAVRVGRSIIAA